MGMTSRERVLMALDHQEPDRVPIVIGASNTTGVKIQPYSHIKDILGIEEEDEYLYNWPELGTVKMSERVLQRLHSDVRPVLDRFPKWFYENNSNRDPHSPHVSDWGTETVEIEPGRWTQATYPLADSDTIESIEKYPYWPDMDDPYRVSHIPELVQQMTTNNQYALMGTPWLLSIFERSMSLQGMDKLLINMSLNPEFAEALLKKVAKTCKTLMGHYLKVCGDDLDIICIGDDLGTQDRLLISPRMYRRILKPIHADYIQFIKERTKAKLFLHTDGDVFDVIDDFVEIGVDILNPIQTSAGKMANLSELKKRYGKNLTFCGAIDTQRILPFGTPEEVRQEVCRVIQELGSGGGYMVAAVHTIMNEVPAENILAMVDAVEEFGKYPLC